jgi:hypothetical protein
MVEALRVNPGFDLNTILTTMAHIFAIPMAINSALLATTLNCEAYFPK